MTGDPKRRWPAWLAALTLALLVTLGVWLYQMGFFQVARLERLSEDLGSWGPPMLAGVIALSVVVGPIPTMVGSLAAGMLYDPLVAYLLSMTGALAGAGISFWIARLLGQPLIERFFPGHLALFPLCPEPLLFGMVLVARLIPVMSFALISYAAGLTTLSTWRFLLASALGMSPMTLLYVMAGTGLARDSAWAIIAGILFLGLLLALPALVDAGWVPLPRRWREYIDHLRHPR